MGGVQANVWKVVSDNAESDAEEWVGYVWRLTVLIRF